MSTYLNYLSDFEKAYSSMIEESFSKQVKKALERQYKSVYKPDGYDQYGVDRNGKYRDGKLAPWRYSEMFNIISVEDLENMLKAAMLRENRRNTPIVHHYDSRGLNSFGYDRQGYDINGVDVLGHSDSEYGTEEYEKNTSERERTLRNLKAKEGMKKTNFLKTHEPLTQKQELFLLNGYKKALLSSNPQQTFMGFVRMLAVRATKDKNGNVNGATFDRGTIGYIMSQFKFPSNVKPLIMNQEDYAGLFVDSIKEQVNRTLRPNKFDDLLTSTVSVRAIKNAGRRIDNHDTEETSESELNDSEYIFSISITPKDGSELNDTLHTGIMQAIRRVCSSTMNYTGYYLSPFRVVGNSFKFYLHVIGIKHLSHEATDLYEAALTRYEKKYNTGSYDPEAVRKSDAFFNKLGVKKLPPL